MEGEIERIMIDIPKFPKPHPGRKTDDTAKVPQFTVDVKNPRFKVKKKKEIGER